MNKRGFLGALAALLALVGGALLFVYVSGADQRALASLDPRPVLVVSDEIPAGMRSADLSEYVELRQIPLHAIVPGAIQQLDELPAEQVTVTSLKVGEQVLLSRFVTPDDNQVAAAVPVPEGLQLITIQLPPERVVGSQIIAGDKVGIYVTMTAASDGAEPSTASPDPEGDPGVEKNQTDLLAADILVARIQGTVAPPAGDGTAAGDQLPASELMVTVAVDSQMAAKIVYSKENGSLWLSRQTPSTDMTGVEPVTSGTVFK
ncbi:pilus assembly protein CpaB [Tessaracoccus sp. MC1865]|uniref:Flp pilus assembly protein CpaB n=1 Tax=Tessaracoccus sp. MC1865 TaxID=2760310 RepID=UPI001601E045|nr:RcpC/CpaB family pilus assembly protein [Tessaracoccus sp. MC1865]MBB1484593.1 pilus assembly protein CpaB [Tessaracoccus sp. MC1865]QTO38319.1 hypothetical protein J7D54_04250 [Tessaracoccus sp. MC1865]